MKIIIWVRKDEAISGKITKWYNICPQQTNWPEWVQVQISQDEFARLEDADEKNQWLVDQYNRNKEAHEYITDVSQIKTK